MTIRAVGGHYPGGLLFRQAHRDINTEVATLVADGEAYFVGNPWRRWFEPMDVLLRAATSTSYHIGSACHLLLVSGHRSRVVAHCRPSDP